MKFSTCFLTLTLALVASSAAFENEQTNYILVPKENSLIGNLFQSFIDLQHFATEHDLEELALFQLTNGLLPMYKTTYGNLKKYKKTLSKIYDIEEDKRVYLNASSVFSNSPLNFKMGQRNHIESTTTPWHLSRVVQRDYQDRGLPFPYGAKGQCLSNDDLIVDTYIVDTGIDISHPQFDGRATWSANFADSYDRDCNNHGTHVAGLVGSKDYGICVDAKLHAVKVLSCDGSGSLSGVIKGIEWVYNSHLTKAKTESTKTVKSIINMSLGGGFSMALNRAVDACTKTNEHFYIVVAAGNDNQDACQSSPASVSSIITVMASDRYDNKAWFSNWGKCANVYAPGVELLSTIPNGKTAILSGTSMATPVVVGILNHYIDIDPSKSLRDMLKYIKKYSTKNAIKNNEGVTSNYLVYLDR